MTIQRIREALTKQPFQAFDLVLSDGRSHTVGHPDFLSIPPVQFPAEVLYYIERGHEDFQARWIDLDLITELVTPTEAAARLGSQRPEGNGA